MSRVAIVYVLAGGTGRGREIEAALIYRDLQLGPRWKVLARAVSAMPSPGVILVAIAALL